MDKERICKNMPGLGLGICFLALLGLVLMILSYTTGYYVFGKANSILILVLIVIAILCTIASLIFQKKQGKDWLIDLLSLLVTISLVAAAALLLGDRVEGIGYTLVTDYDAGHGGEEACIMSLVSSGIMLLDAILNITKNFLKK